MKIGYIIHNNDMREEWGHPVYGMNRHNIISFSNYDWLI